MTAMAAGRLRVTGEPSADRLLVDDPLALLVGMLLDQQVPMEWAFRSPLVLKERLGGTLDAAAIASMPPEELDAIFRAKPALHRYPGNMAKRTQTLCRHLVDSYDGDPARVWTEAGSAEDLYRRIRELPGYGEQKARIFLAVLGKRLGRAPDGWQEYAGPYGEDTPRSVADVDSADTLEKVREHKRAEKETVREHKRAEKKKASEPQPPA